MVLTRSLKKLHSFFYSWEELKKTVSTSPANDQGNKPSKPGREESSASKSNNQDPLDTNESKPSPPKKPEDKPFNEFINEELIPKLGD